MVIFKCVVFGVHLTKKDPKTINNLENMVIFNGRGCLTLMRTKGDKGFAFGGPFDSKIFKNGQE